MSSNRQPGVLFISHDAWRTGAPMVLLHVLHWIKTNSTLPFKILLRDGSGELRPQFEALAPLFVFGEPDDARGVARGQSLRGWLQHGVGGRSRATGRHVSNFDGGFEALSDDPSISVVYSNTITNGAVLEALARPWRTVITHVHELEYWIRYRIDPDDLARTQRHTVQYVAASNAVKENLIAIGVPHDHIEVVYECTPAYPRVPSDARTRIRERLRIPHDAFVVGASGTTDWRKAPDLFVQLAALIRRDGSDPDTHFVWVGGACDGPEFGALWHDVVRTATQDHVHFVGRKEDPLQYFEAIDVFASVSREDPFPLVCLEAASLGKPIVCFSGSGGAQEFVADDAGIVVPYLDLAGMAKAILHLAASPRMRAELGHHGLEKVRAHHDVDVIAPRLLDLIRRAIPDTRNVSDVG